MGFVDKTGSEDSRWAGCDSVRNSLQNGALLLLLLSREKSSTCSVLKDFPDTFVGLGRAFEVLLCTNLLANILSLEEAVLACIGDTTRAIFLRLRMTYLLWRHWLLRGLVQLLDCLLVVSEILLATDENDGQALAEVEDF